MYALISAIFAARCAAVSELWAIFSDSFALFLEASALSALACVFSTAFSISSFVRRSAINGRTRLPA
jgi:hypothetical protein